MKIKLPSLDTLGRGALRVFKRFPLEVVVTILGTVTWYYAIDAKNEKVAEQLIKLILICNLALTLLLASDLFSEAGKLSVQKKWGMRLIAILICTGLYFALRPLYELADVYRMGLLAFAFHLLVAFAPFIRRGNLNGFWQYNKSLFLRFLTAALYAFVLFSGLAIALLAIDGLFNAAIHAETYVRLFALVTGGFMTVFFLAGVPADFELLDVEQAYPKGLKIFTQYVLIPLMTIYLAILLVYEIKIIVNWELPKGLVSMLILGYAVFGILSLLLVYPVRDKEENSWIKLFSRFFYVMMIPLVVLLLLAVWKRVGNYGITESRYILIVLALWLTIVTGYFLFSRKQNIMVIPMSLCLLALLAVYGPQSAFSISKYSQLARLKKVMASKNKKDIGERASVIRYLVERHGLTSLQGFTKVDLQGLEQKLESKSDSLNFSRYTIEEHQIDTALALLNVDKKDKYKTSETVTFKSDGGEALDIKGYDHMGVFQVYQKPQQITLNGDVFELEKSGDSEKLFIKLNGNTGAAIDISGMIRTAMNAYERDSLKEVPKSYHTYYVPKEWLIKNISLGGYDIRYMATSLVGNVNKEEQTVAWGNFEGYLLIKKR